MLRCPNCHSARVWRLRRKAWDRILSLLGLFPFRCESCTTHFRARPQRYRLIF